MIQQKTRSPLVQETARNLFGAKLLAEPVMTNYQLNPQEQSSFKLGEMLVFILITCI